MRAIQGTVGALCVATTLAAQASVFYKFDIVAQTGQDGIVSLGTGPSVNAKGKVAYVGTYAGGPSVFSWSPAGGRVDVAPGFLSTSRSFGDAVMINFHDEIVTWNRILPQALYEIRVFRAGAPDDSSLAVRGTTTGQPYNILFQGPAINANRVLEDRSSAVPTGDKDGLCEAGEVCFSQVAFGAYENTPTIARYLGTVQTNPAGGADQGTRNEYALNTTNSRPALADDGRVAVRGLGNADPILLFAYGLGAPTQIAGAAQGFTRLGVAPGITPDGKVVAFAGNRGFGTGVFLSIELPGGQRRIVRVAGENDVVKKPELGHDETGSRLHLASVDVDSRVGIAYTPGRDGTANASVVVAFVGTPNAQSRQNAGTGKPFYFSAQKGLWTLRVDLDAPLIRDQCVVLAEGAAGNPFTTRGDDAIASANGVFYVSAGANGLCESDNTHDSETLLSRVGPVPVVQVGDSILAHTVADIGVHDPIAPANFTDAQTPRAMRLGDHRVAFWAAAAGGTQLIVRGEHLDSDQDGLYDHWETAGIDLDGTGTIDLDLPAMGADPFARDLFIQIDWVADDQPPLNEFVRHRPAAGVVQRVVDYFAAAPALASGVPAGIRVHVDAGPWFDSAGMPLSTDMGTALLRGGKVVWPAPLDVVHFDDPSTFSLPGVAMRAFGDIKAQNVWNSERGARQFAFTSVVWANSIGAHPKNKAPMTGTVTAADAWTINDANNPDLADVAGLAVKITGGTGAGQVRVIGTAGVAQNSATTGAIDVRVPFTVVPDATSTYAILDGSGGQAAAGSRLDGGFAHGKDVIVATGVIRRYLPGYQRGSFVQHWKGIVHELGHLMTLLHGGVDHDNFKPDYVSLMNYAYAMCSQGVGTDEDGTPLPGAAACPIDAYAGSADAVRDDWATLDMATASVVRFGGDTFGHRNSALLPFPPDETEQTPAQIERQFGPQDDVEPRIQPIAPAGGVNVAAGGNIAVAFGASDDVGIARAEVLFDANGDGRIVRPGEAFAALPGGGGYAANVPVVSGPPGPRRLVLAAYDARGNGGFATVVVTVGGVAPAAVPSVVGASEPTAREAIATADFTVGAVTFAASPSVPAGLVLSQLPAAASVQPLGTPVALVVSLGPNGAVVPNVNGLTQAAAATAIANAGFALGTVTTGLPGTDPPGRVRGQSPVAGAAAPAGSAIALLVAPGSAGNVTVPSVIALSQAAATSALNAAGLVVGVVTMQSSPTVPVGHVIAQTPPAGSSVAAGSAVDLVVSSGPPQVVVPDVVGQGVSSATVALTGAGLVVGTVTHEVSTTVPFNVVISQAPAAGASVAAGSAVALVVSLGPPCGAFTDVAASSPFCSSVEWMRNRGITQGCTPSAYCPDADVSRLAMAAFMNRLGSALTPGPAVTEAATGAFDPSTATVLCVAPTVAASGAPRRMRVDGVVNLAGDGSAPLVVEIVASVDAGTTWTPVGTQVVSIQPGRWSGVRVAGARDVAVGESVAFALRVARGGFPGTATVVDGACRLRTTLENRQSTVEPFDR